VKFSEHLVQVNFCLFAAFGLGFAFFPEVLAPVVTGSEPASSSGLIDMRANYGGMALGLAYLFWLCRKGALAVQIGVRGVFGVMIFLSLSRLFGIIVDGSANTFMHILLGAEVLMAVLAAIAIRLERNSTCNQHKAKHFSTDGKWGKLLPYQKGLRFRIPSWIALLIAAPFLIFFEAAIFTGSVPMQFLFGVPGALFVALWLTSRRISPRFGRVRINKEEKLGVFTNKDGSESTVHFGRFQSINIELLIADRNTYSSMAVLYGETGSLILETGLSRPSLINRMSPVAAWLEIDIEVSDKKTYLSKLLFKPDFRTDPP